MNNNLLPTDISLELLAGNMNPDGNGNWKLNPTPIKLASISAATITYYRTYSVVFSMITGNNDFAASLGLHHGCSVNFNNAVITVTERIGLTQGHLRGNGTNFTLNGDIAGFAVGTNSVSDFIFSPATLYSATAAQSTGVFWKNATANYVGTTANRKVIELTSGLSGSQFGFRLVDSTTGLAVVANSTTDAIEISINQTQTPSTITSANTAVTKPRTKINLIGIDLK